jgi:large subunit ribosomal protein L10
MSKYVKNLVADDIKKRLQGVQDALLVNMVGMNSSSTYTLRKELRAKKINILVVKNSMAARATTGTSLARLFDGVGGSAAICWGSDDIVALAKSITTLLKGEKFPAFQPRGGVMDGEQISADQIAEVAKWPTRAEQLSLLVGQILSVGSRLNGQLIAVGGALASQIAEKAKGAEEEAAAEGAAAADEGAIPAGAPENAVSTGEGAAAVAATESPAPAGTPPADGAPAA